MNHLNNVCFGFVAILGLLLLIRRFNLKYTLIKSFNLHSCFKRLFEILSTTNLY